MENIRYTMKELRKCCKCFAVLNGKMQNLVKPERKSGYVAGAIGWNADVYIRGNICVSTGARPFGKDVTKLARKYDKQAEDKYDACEWVSDFVCANEEVHDLFEEFIAELEMM